MKTKRVEKNKPIIKVNDIFDELKVENNRLQNELLFANKCLKILFKFKDYLNCIYDKIGDNLEIKLRQELDQLEVEYRQVLNENIRKNEITFQLNDKQEIKEEEVVYEQLDNNNDNKDMDYYQNICSDLLNEDLNQTISNHIISSNNKNSILSDNCSIGEEIVTNGGKVENVTKSDGIRDSLDKSLTKKYCYSFKCQFSGCDFVTGRNARLKAHTNYHTGQRPYKCSVFGCDKAFVGRESLTTHIKSVHNSVETIKCDVFKFTKKTTKTKRNKPILIGDKPYVCPFPECPYRARTRQALCGHKLTHGERTIQCTFVGCGKVFKNKSLLRSHSLIHNNEPHYKCNYDGCEAAFRTHKTLKIHTLVHTNEAPKCRCDWPGCEFSSVYNWIVQRHRQMHTDERPFKCVWPSCESSFRRRHYMKAHMLKHSGEKPYACDWPGCDRRFQSNQALRFHNEKVHGNRISVVKHH